jgi:ribosomal protein S18 acetylase RimI-like enzyme
MLYHALYVAPGDAPFPPEVVLDPSISNYVLGWGRAGDQGVLAIVETIVEPVGAAWMLLFSSETAGYGYVDAKTPELSIAVLPEYRNQGIGTAMLIRLLKEAASSYPAVSLSVSPSNPAIRLYQRLGFEFFSDEGESSTMIRRFNESAIRD